MSETHSGVVLCWYFHLATACSDTEVHDLASRSILPLIRAHRWSRQPVVLALSGTLLRRLGEECEGVVDELRGLCDEGLCEIAATCFHEVYPPCVPIEHLGIHIERDIAEKRAWLGVEPAVFYPPNLVWIGAFETILAANGIRAVILDGGHYRYATSVQTWRWTLTDVKHMKTELLDTHVDARETWRAVPYVASDPACRESSQSTINCYFRDDDAVSKLSFGSNGLIHHVGAIDELRDLAETLSALVRGGNLITLADDGDRVNPVSLYGYESFLEWLGDGGCVLPKPPNTLAPTIPMLSYLPSYAIAGFDAFIREGLDSSHYLQILSEIASSDALRPVDEDELMALQDVFFLFWKTLPRKRVYLERALALRAEVAARRRL